MSGTVIITKFSLTNAQPISNALSQGEQAYSFTSDKLWIGEDNGVTIDPIAIGGKFYTDQLPAASSGFGTLVANQALVVDSNKKIDVINVDNITLDGNTISTTDTNGDLTISPNGTGSVGIQANTDVVGNLTVSGTTSITGQSSFTSINVTDLTDGRVLLAGSNGELEDSGNLTFDGSTLTVTGIIDADNVRIDGNTISAINTNGGLTLTPTGTGLLTVDTDQAMVVPYGTLGTRPSAGTVGDGAIRYNTTDNRFEGSVNGSWTGLGGVVDVDQDTYITAEATADDDTLTFVTAGTTEVTVDVSGMDITDNLTVGGNTVIGGNLTVNGTTTTVNSTVTELTDPVISLGEGSLAAGDANDRGANFEWGDGSSVKTGFFGMDMQTGRFSFKKDVNTADENYVSPWSDAQFDNLYLSSDLEVQDIVMTGTSLTTSGGTDLTITPSGGDVNITTNLNVSGDVSFANDVPVASGGTGLSSFTGNSIFVSNGTGDAVAFIAPPSTNPEDYIIKFNSSGVPVASNTIDGGTF